jgi:hypothetical protein
MSSELFVQGSSESKTNLFVTFGGLAMSMDGIPPFEFCNILNKILPQYDKYFYIDKKQTWYHKGMEGISKNIPETVEYLREKISGYDKVYFIGNSSGGYAALLFGSLLGVDKILAFQPQTDLSKCNGVKFKDPKYIDIKPYLNYNTKYLLFGNTTAPSGHNHDINQCVRIADQENVSLVKIPRLNLKKLRDEGKLEGIILSLCSNK